MQKQQIGALSYLVSLLDEVDLAAEVEAKPDNGPNGRIHALAVTARREDGNGLAGVRVGLDHPLGGGIWCLGHAGGLAVLTKKGVLKPERTKTPTQKTGTDTLRVRITLKLE